MTYLKHSHDVVTTPRLPAASVGRLGYVIQPSLNQAQLFQPSTTVYVIKPSVSQAQPFTSSNQPSTAIYVIKPSLKQAEPSATPGYCCA